MSRSRVCQKKKKKLSNCNSRASESENKLLMPSWVYKVLRFKVMVLITYLFALFFPSDKNMTFSRLITDAYATFSYGVLISRLALKCMLLLIQISINFNVSQRSSN